MDDTTEQSGSSPNERLTALRGVVLTSSEGHVLLAGIAGAFIYSVWLGFQLVISPSDFQALIGMTATEVVFGRIACMAFGYSLGLGNVEVILICMVLETILVLIFYPLFVFIWRHLLVIRWLKRLSDRTRRAAEKHKDIVHKYGIIGLFAFVWLPFWMTGPVVGCMIGYLLRLRVWVNIVTVLTGTYVAILGWAFLMIQLRRQTMSYSAYSLVVLAAVVAACGLTWVIKRHVRRKNHIHRT
ncbi:MAG: small multi-drug export protein [Planctomycetota bacterium]